MANERIPFKTGDVIVTWEKSKGYCGICGKRVKPHDACIDHIVPVTKNGRHELDNWQLAHRLCNMAKGNRLILPVIPPHEPKPITVNPALPEQEKIEFLQRQANHWRREYLRVNNLYAQAVMDYVEMINRGSQLPAPQPETVVIEPLPETARRPRWQFWRR